MSRLSFSEEGNCSSADEERSEEGEKESEKGVVWEELEMGCILCYPWFDSCNCVVFYFYFIHCVQIATEHILSVEAMCGFFDNKGYDNDGCT